MIALASVQAAPPAIPAGVPEKAKRAWTLTQMGLQAPGMGHGQPWDLQAFGNKSMNKVLSLPFK